MNLRAQGKSQNLEALGSHTEYIKDNGKALKSFLFVILLFCFVFQVEYFKQETVMVGFLF